MQAEKKHTDRERWTDRPIYRQAHYNTLHSSLRQSN